MVWLHLLMVEDLARCLQLINDKFLRYLLEKVIYDNTGFISKGNRLFLDLSKCLYWTRCAHQSTKNLNR